MHPRLRWEAGWANTRRPCHQLRVFNGQRGSGRRLRQTTKSHWDQKIPDRGHVASVKNRLVSRATAASVAAAAGQLGGQRAGLLRRGRVTLVSKSVDVLIDKDDTQQV